MNGREPWWEKAACSGEDPEAFFPLADEDEPQDWQDHARCAEVDGELFFPEKGCSTREAKAVCMACEVRQQCLEYAVEMESRPGTHGQFGIWGGLSARQRRPLVAARIEARARKAVA